MPLLVLCAPAGASSSNGLAGLSTSSTYTFNSLNIPKSFHISTLGTLYKDAKLREVTVATVDTQISVVLFRTSTHKYAAQYVAGTSASLVSRLLADNVNVTVSTTATLTGSPGGGSDWWEPVAAMVILGGAMYLMFGLHAGKGWRFWRWRKTAAKVGVHLHNSTKAEDVPDVTFADVAGSDEAVASLLEIVEFIKDPEKYERVGATRPKGALLVGPPGTGKTLLARAVAGEAGVPFFSASGSDFVEMFAGVGAKRIRELFARAHKAKGGSAIIFIDEIDAVARKRSAGAHTGGGADSEREGTLVALLTQLDGFTSSRVMVLAATNRPDVLDPAVTRPGRLDRRIEVPNPDRRGRERILQVHSKSRPLATDVDLGIIASRTGGLSGADLANIVNEAAIGTARRGAKELTMDDFDSAIMTSLMGRARLSALVTDHDRTVTAWHEAGHTVCAFSQEAADPPVSVSIVPRGPAGGVTAMSEGDNNFLQRSKAAAQLVTALGGRAAEQMILGGDYTQGACGDLSTATALATRMATDFGMTSLGLMVREAPQAGLARHSDVEQVVESLLKLALAESTRVLRENRLFLEKVAGELLKEDTLDHQDLERIYQDVGAPQKVSAASTLRAMFGEDSDALGEITGAWIA
jgi:cell division protease FtsH